MDYVDMVSSIEAERMAQVGQKNKDTKFHQLTKKIKNKLKENKNFEQK